MIYFVCAHKLLGVTLLETQTPGFSFQASTWPPNALESDKGNGKAYWCISSRRHLASGMMGGGGTSTRTPGRGAFLLATVNLQ